MRLLRKAARPFVQPSTQTSKASRPRPSGSSIGKLRAFIGHELANFVHHAPSRLIGDADMPLEFQCRHVVAAGGHQEDGKEPRHQRRSGLVEDRSGSRVKLVSAPSARIRTAIFQRVKAIFLRALRACAAVRPSLLKEEIQTRPVVRELLLKI